MNGVKINIVLTKKYFKIFQQTDANYLMAIKTETGRTKHKKNFQLIVQKWFCKILLDSSSAVTKIENKNFAQKIQKYEKIKWNGFKEVMNLRIVLIMKWKTIFYICPPKSYLGLDACYPFFIDFLKKNSSHSKSSQYIGGTKDLSVATIYRTCFGPSELKLWYFLYFVFDFCTKIHNADLTLTYWLTHKIIRLILIIYIYSKEPYNKSHLRKNNFWRS
ncbi:hypothetical protein BpHYR1_020659 [Brachionus plicatilis]|uniref:Uncharacterized protein n=1 Tax=Brachionus plicatilis TaxID=10195 RepID=A0A3M7T7A6_BRAPC|nr:hypothetical protein BpHYR1_020659 [Brachionus plicatilis]